MAKNSRIGLGMKPRGVAPSEPQLTQETPQVSEGGVTITGLPEGYMGGVDVGSGDDVSVSADEVQSDTSQEAQAGSEEVPAGGGTLEPESVQNLDSTPQPSQSALEALMERSKATEEGDTGNDGPEQVATEPEKPATEALTEAPEPRNDISAEPQQARNDMVPIGNVRRSMFTSYESKWNGYVRDLTAALEVGGEVSVSVVQEKVFEDAARAMGVAELMTFCQFDPPAEVGEQPDGSYKAVVTIGEGYWQAIKDWAEADGLTPEEWLSNLVTANIETYGQPAKAR